MKAVILAAGRGTRMGSLTGSIPKPMLPLLSRPMLEWKIETLPDGIDEVILTVGYLGDRIREHFGESWHGRTIRYVHQAVLNGSGGSIALVKEAGYADAPLLVTMGDDLYHPDDLTDLLSESSAVLGLFVDDAERFGLLEETPEGKLANITERPHTRVTGTVNTGAYMLSPKYFEYAPVRISEAEFGLPQTLALLSRDDPVRVIRARAWQPVGTPDDIPKGEEFVRRWYR